MQIIVWRIPQLKSEDHIYLDSTLNDISSDWPWHRRTISSFRHVLHIRYHRKMWPFVTGFHGMWRAFLHLPASDIRIPTVLCELKTRHRLRIDDAGLTANYHNKWYNNCRCKDVCGYIYILKTNNQDVKCCEAHYSFILAVSQSGVIKLHPASPDTAHWEMS